MARLARHVPTTEASNKCPGDTRGTPGGCGNKAEAPSAKNTKTAAAIQKPIRRDGSPR